MMHQADLASLRCAVRMRSDLFRFGATTMSFVPPDASNKLRTISKVAAEGCSQVVRFTVLSQ